MTLRYSMSFDDDEVAVLLAGLYTVQEDCKAVPLAQLPAVKDITSRLIRLIGSACPDIDRQVQRSAAAKDAVTPKKRKAGK